MTELKRVIAITPSKLNYNSEHDPTLYTYFDILCQGTDGKTFNIPMVSGDCITTLEQGTIIITGDGKAVSRNSSKIESYYLIKKSELDQLIHEFDIISKIEKDIRSRKVNLEMKPAFPCSHVHEQKACRRCPEFLKCEICDSVKHQTLKEMGFSTGNDNANKDEQMK